MSDTPKPKLGDMVPVDIRIKNVNDIPAKYFLEDRVLEALHQVIRSEVVVHGKPVPPGAEAIFSAYTTGAARRRMAVANSELGYQLQRLTPGMIMLFFIGGLIVLIGLIYWGLFHG